MPCCSYENSFDLTETLETSWEIPQMGLRGTEDHCYWVVKYNGWGYVLLTEWKSIISQPDKVHFHYHGQESFALL